MPPKKKEEEAGILETIAQAIGLGGSGKVSKTPVGGFHKRVKNAIKYSWRGIFGFLIPCIFVPLMWDRWNNAKKVEIMWYIMFWFILIRPVNVPVCGLVPIFFLPMTGVHDTLATCSCYMSDTIVLYLMGGILILLLNNSGVDRRIALSFMAGGKDADQFTAKKLVYKCSMAAFLLSFLSNRLLASAMITEYMTKAMMSVESTHGALKGEANLKEIRYVINNAIQTSASIGSSVMMHSGYGCMAFRSIFAERGITYPNSEYPDIFNYLQYSAFALPLAVIKFVVNLAYFYILASKAGGKKMSPRCRTSIQKQLKDNQAKLPSRMTLHEKLTIISLAIALFFLFYRWSEWIGGWATFQRHPKLTYKGEPLVAVKDTTVAAIFVVLFHTLPASFSFTKYCTATKRSELPPCKQESGILWWRFSDKNLNYSYFFLIGAGNVLTVVMIRTGLSAIICEHSGHIFSDHSWNIAMFLVLFGCSVAISIMPETAAVSVYLPFVLAIADGPVPWPTHVYLPALGIGILGNYGFLYPFKYSPAYNCHYVGKTPVKKMIIHGLGSIIICFIFTWLAITFVAPTMWDPQNLGIPPSSPEGAPPDNPPPE